MPQTAAPLAFGKNNMASTLHETETGHAVIGDKTAEGTEQLVVTLHPESGLLAEFVFNEGMTKDALIATSGIEIDRAALQRLVQWLREQGALD